MMRQIFCQEQYICFIGNQILAASLEPFCYIVLIMLPKLNKDHTYVTLKKLD